MAMIPIKKKTLVRNRKCSFCGTKTDPDYKNVEILKKSVSDRGKILSGDRSGTCSKHQRQVAREIKKARHLALIPFVSGM